MYVRKFLSKVFYGVETFWGMRLVEKGLKVPDMKCLRRTVQVVRMDRMKNEELRRKGGI